MIISWSGGIIRWQGCVCGWLAVTHGWKISEMDIGLIRVSIFLYTLDTYFCSLPDHNFELLYFNFLKLFLEFFFFVWKWDLPHLDLTPTQKKNIKKNYKAKMRGLYVLLGWDFWCWGAATGDTAVCGGSDVHPWRTMTSVILVQVEVWFPYYHTSPTIKKFSS